MITLCMVTGNGRYVVGVVADEAGKKETKVKNTKDNEDEDEGSSSESDEESSSEEEEDETDSESEEEGKSSQEIAKEKALQRIRVNFS